MAMLPRMTKKGRENYHYFAETMRELEFHLRGRITDSGVVPDEWQEIAKLREPMPKVRICLWVDGDVVKFFRGMGKGHTSRMADVLRAYRFARLSDVLRGAEGVDYTPEKGADLLHRLMMLREAVGLRNEVEAEEEEAREAASRRRFPG